MLKEVLNNTYLRSYDHGHAATAPLRGVAAPLRGVALLVNSVYTENNVNFLLFAH